MKHLNLDKIKAKLDRLPDQFEGKVAQVGIPVGQQYEDGTTVAYVAAIHEFGAPEVKIPARPFFRPTIQEKKTEWVRIMKHGAKMVSDGNWTAEDALDLIGEKAAKNIIETVSNIYEPELSPVTVLLRKWRKENFGNDRSKITGRTVGEAAAAIANGEDPGSDNKPLNDSGKMVASITYAVNKEGAEFIK